MEYETIEEGIYLLKQNGIPVAVDNRTNTTHLVEFKEGDVKIFSTYVMPFYTISIPIEVYGNYKLLCNG